MRGLVVVALENGKLLIFNAMTLDQHGDETVLMTPGPHCMHVSLAAEQGPAQGLCVVGDDRLVMWTADGMSAITFSKDWEIRSRRYVEWPGIKTIRWDSANSRLVVAHDYHLSICTLDFVEIARLYLLPRGRQLIHVPYPTALRTGLKKNHPGYFWTDADESEGELLELTDNQGQIVTDSSIREFLKQYRSEFMIRQALGDYSRWVETLRDPTSRSSNWGRCALLPCLPDHVYTAVE